LLRDLQTGGDGDGDGDDQADEVRWGTSSQIDYKELFRCLLKYSN
jgi:hypothetical protein